MSVSAVAWPSTANQAPQIVQQLLALVPQADRPAFIAAFPGADCGVEVGSAQIPSHGARLSEPLQVRHELTVRRAAGLGLTISGASSDVRRSGLCLVPQIAEPVSLRCRHLGCSLLTWREGGLLCVRHARCGIRTRLPVANGDSPRRPRAGCASVTAS